MSELDIKKLALEHYAAHVQSQTLVPPSDRFVNFDFGDAYAVAEELVGLRRENGHSTIGRKIGFTNQALWAEVGLDTPIWAHVYNSTVHPAIHNNFQLSLAGMILPRIEPELVFKLRSAIPAGITDPKVILSYVEAFALGLEVVDCHYPNWKFRPADAIADFGVHAALIIGEFQAVTDSQIHLLSEQLANMRASLFKGNSLVENGVGKNVLGNPAAALGFLATVLSQQSDAEPLSAGEIITTGTLTAAPRINAGETWTAEITGLELPRLSVHLSN